MKIVHPLALASVDVYYIWKMNLLSLNVSLKVEDHHCIWCTTIYKYIVYDILHTRVSVTMTYDILTCSFVMPIFNSLYITTLLVSHWYEQSFDIYNSLFVDAAYHAWIQKCTCEWRALECAKIVNIIACMVPLLYFLILDWTSNFHCPSTTPMPLKSPLCA